MTTTHFLTLPDRQLEWTLVEPLTKQLPFIAAEKQNDWLLDLSPGYRMLFTTWVLEGEVNNGGFNHFFSKEGRSFATFLNVASDGFRLIDCPELAQVAEEARQLFQKYARVTEGLVEFSHDGVYDKLEKLDRLFYRHKEALRPQRSRYIRLYTEEFNL